MRTLAAALLLTVGGCAAQPGQPAQDQARAARAALVTGYMDAQQHALEERLRSPGVAVVRSGEQLVVALLESKLFDGDDLAFSESGSAALRHLAGVARHYDRTVLTVRAFTDAAPSVRGAGPRERAQAVAHALIVDGVPRNRIYAQGYGATRRSIGSGKRVSVPGDRRIEIRISLWQPR